MDPLSSLFKNNKFCLKQAVPVVLFIGFSLQMSPSVRAAINDLSAKHRRDHCGLVRSTCAFLLHVCEDEYQLYRQFFHTDSQQFK